MSRDYVAKEYQRCRHFNGVQHDCCLAGVRYDDVRDDPGSGPYRWPCLTLIGRPAATTTCSERLLMTREDLDAEGRALDAAVGRALKATAEGKCHECGADIEPSRIVGRCKYAACGHRIGQVVSDEEP
jgi:hypothetical protein